MAEQKSSGFVERYDDIQLARRKLFKDIQGVHQAFLEGKKGASTGNPVQDAVIALHGVDLVRKPMILEKWNAFAERFTGHEEEPFLVAERRPGSRQQSYIVRPEYWIGTVPSVERLFKIVPTLHCMRETDIYLRTADKFTLAALFVGSKETAWDPVELSEGRPRITDLRNSLYGGFDTVDGILEQLDVPLSKGATSYGGKEAGSRLGYPYYKGGKLGKMAMLEVVVGEDAIGSWVESNPVPGEREIVTKSLTQHLARKAVPAA